MRSETRIACGPVRETHCFSDEFLGKVAEAVRRRRPLAIVVDVDNLLYTTGNSDNYEGITQKRMIRFMADEFGLSEGQASKLRGRMKGLSGGTTIGGIYELAFGRPDRKIRDHERPERPSAVLEMLYGHRDCKSAWLAEEVDALLNDETDQRFLQASYRKATDEFKEIYSPVVLSEMLQRFGAYVWQPEPGAENMLVRSGAGEALLALHDSGVLLAAHSTSCTPGVINILKHVMKGAFPKVFGENGEHVFGVDKTGYLVKPCPQSYQTVRDYLKTRYLDAPTPFIVFFDDSVRNCEESKAVYDASVAVRNNAWPGDNKSSHEWVEQHKARGKVDGLVHDDSEAECLAEALRHLNEHIQEVQQDRHRFEAIPQVSRK